MDDLFREFAAADARITQGHLDQLFSLGVPRDVWCGVRPSLIGAVRAEVHKDSTYDPSETGQAYYVTPCGIFGPGGIGWIDIYDLVIWKPSAPSQWWRHTKDGPILNSDEIERCRYFEEPLHLHSTPLSWLAASGHGSCILDWSINLSLALGNAPVIDCDSVALAEKVSTALRDPGHVPAIRVLQTMDIDNAA